MSEGEREVRNNELRAAEGHRGMRAADPNVGLGRGSIGVRDEKRAAGERRALGARPTVPGFADCPPETAP